MVVFGENNICPLVFISYKKISTKWRHIFLPRRCMEFERVTITIDVFKISADKNNTSWTIVNSFFIFSHNFTLSSGYYFILFRIKLESKIKNY